MEFLIILAAVAVIVLSLFIAEEFARIAAMKGYKRDNRYFWWTFLCGIVGMAMVIALPSEGKAADNTGDDELPEI